MSAPPTGKHKHRAVTAVAGMSPYDYCRCGAVRERPKPDGTYVAPWHVCDECRLPGWTKEEAPDHGR